MTEDELREIEERAAKPKESAAWIHGTNLHMGQTIEVHESAWVTAARSDVPALCVEVRRLQELERLALAWYRAGFEQPEADAAECALEGWIVARAAALRGDPAP